MSNKTRKTQLKQVQNQSQSGRSMVEMLGVLAIIGVLSIGGISGYKMAMDRYQANQIANEINLMRTDAKIKVAQGAEKLMLGEPYDSGHLNFGSNYGVEFDFAVFSEAGEAEESGYYIKVSGVPAGVCKPLVTLLEGMDDAIAVVVNELENNADSSADLCTEESNNALEVDFSTEKIISGNGEEPEPPEEQGDEPKCDDETCAGGVCQADDTCKCNDPNEYWTGYGCTACPNGALQAEGKCECTEEESHLRGSRCIMCPEEAEWSDKVGDCVCKESGKLWSSDGKCIDNVCNSGTGCPDDEDGNPQYCDIVLSDCSNGVPSASSGECKSINDGDSNNGYTAVEVTNGTEGTKTIYKSSKEMDWWAADAFCQALGRKLGKPMHLVSLEGDLGCPTSGSCPTGSYGKSLADKLQINDFGWTSTPYNHDNTFCIAYAVYLRTGEVGRNNRNGDYFSGSYALCE